MTELLYRWVQRRLCNRLFGYRVSSVKQVRWQIEWNCLIHYYCCFSTSGYNSSKSNNYFHTYKIMVACLTNFCFYRVKGRWFSFSPVVKKAIVTTAGCKKAMVVFKKTCRSQGNLANMFKLELSYTVCEQMKVVY